MTYKETERNDENTVVYYNPNRNTKTEFDKLLEENNNFRLVRNEGKVL